MLTTNYILDVEAEKGLNAFYDKLDEQQQYFSFEEYVADFADTFYNNDDDWYGNCN